MVAERDILHQRVGELEQIRDAHLTSLHFPLLLAHGELRWHLAVWYQGDATNHNNRISRHNFAAYQLCFKSNVYSLLHVSWKTN